MAERPAFRPDIEGLRGVAILLVVLFHAGVASLAGGFVGVDVFFVLSGYFITGLLVHEVSETGRVDVTAFHARRALRLVPLLVVVLLATLGLVTWLYAPIDRAPIAAAGRAVALSYGNVEFARGAVDYFSSGENPLLHTWSLAVEEQFYAVWPFLFVAAAIIHERRATLTESRERPARALLPWIAGVGVASLIASLWLTRVAQPWAFFTLPTRLWEFAAGGATAVLVTRPMQRGGRALQVAGLAAIAIAVACYDRATPYPGVAALLPALGAIAFIVGGHGMTGDDSPVLTARPLRWLGRMSYGWYLWHWPLVGVAAVLRPDIGVAGKLAWSAGALALAWLTHRVVEEPARTGWLARRPAPVLLGATLGASLVALLLAHAAMRAGERAAASPSQRAYLAARTDRMSTQCWATTIEEWRGPCIVGDAGGATTIALLGDSHAEHWLAGLDRAGRERGWRVDAMVKGGCPVASMSGLVYPRLQRYYHECTRYREAMLRRIIAMRPAAVVLSSWDHYLPRDGAPSPWQVTPAMWERGLRETYGRLTRAGLRVIVIRDVPTIPFDAPGCLSRRDARLPFATSCTFARAASLAPMAVAAQDRAARGLPVRFVDMNDQLCATATCPVVRGGEVVFTDDNHLTARFSRSVAPALGARLASALQP